MRNGLAEGGTTGLMKVKNSLHGTGSRAVPPEPSEAAVEDVPASWRVECREDGRACRAHCSFLKTVHYDDAARVFVVLGPWRSSSDACEEDATCMTDAYETGGVPNVQKMKNELFRSAFTRKPSAPEPEGTEDSSERRSRGLSTRSRSRSSEAQNPTVSVSVQVEHADGRYRAVCELPVQGEEAFKKHGSFSICCPWRANRHEAKSDGEAVVTGHAEGGHTHASKVKNSLFQEARQRLPSDAAVSSRVRSLVDGVDEDVVRSMVDSVEELRGGFRAACRFETQKEVVRTGFRKNAGTMSITGPLRVTSEQAREDVDTLSDAHAVGGMFAVHKCRNEMFRSAFAKPPQDTSEPVSGPPDDPHGVTEVAEIEADRNDRGDRGRGFRATCWFSSFSASENFSANSAGFALTGPWRAGRDDAEADKIALVEAYRSGGMDMAKECKNEMRRVARGGDVGVKVTEKLSVDELADKYGKGYLLAQRMGYSGAGLGRSEQGRDKLVSLDGARAAVGSAARRGLGEATSSARVRSVLEELEGATEMEAGEAVGLASGSSKLGERVVFERAGMLDTSHLDERTLEECRGEQEELHEEDESMEWVHDESGDACVERATRCDVFWEAGAIHDAVDAVACKEPASIVQRLLAKQRAVSGLPPLENPRARVPARVPRNSA